MQINGVRGAGFLPFLPEENGETTQEEAMEEVKKAKRAVEVDRLEIMDRHHETVKKSSEKYDKLVKKKLLEEEVEKRRLLQREFHAERMQNDEIRRRDVEKDRGN